VAKRAPRYIDHRAVYTEVHVQCNQQSTTISSIRAAVSMQYQRVTDTHTHRHDNS